MTNLPHFILSGIRYLLPRFWCITGQEKLTGADLSFIWCGPEKQCEYIARRIFGAEPFDKTYVGRRPIFMMDRLQKTYNCSLAIVAGPKHILSCLCREDDICVPWWVDAELNIDDAEETIGRPKSLKDDFRRVRINKLDFKIASDVENYKFFYDRVYLPTITSSHGDAAIPASFGDRCAEIEAGGAEVMLITMDEEAIGGLVLNYRNGIPVLRDIGVIDGNREILKTGVVTAAYAFAMQYLKGKGFKTVCLGLSRCFLNDGVLIYKQKWKPTLIEASQEFFLFRVSDLCDASRAFLRSSSFISEEEGEFHFAFFAANDDDVCENRSKLRRLSSIYGIDSYSSIDLSGPQPQMRKAS